MAISKKKKLVELPEDTLLIRASEQDGTVIEKKAFRVVQGVVTVEMVTILGELDSIVIEYRPGCRLDTETVNGEQTTGTLVRVEK